MATYQKPSPIMARINAMLSGLVIGRLGKTMMGAQLLEVKGRTSGALRSVPVNVLELDGERYLVAPRGETQWVRNFRAAGEGVLRVGDKREPILGRELADDDKPHVLRAYLDRWYWEVSSQVDVSKDASLEELAEVAQNHPVFHIHNEEIV